jgi:hypothetical protein
MNRGTERRTRKRIVTEIPVRIRSDAGREQSAQTRDLSTNGIFLYTTSRMAEGSDLEMVLLLPPELTSGKRSWVCCQARVVRVEEGPGRDFGIAAEIRRMDMLPEIAL